jgi:hypothetical protein
MKLVYSKESAAEINISKESAPAKKEEKKRSRFRKRLQG